MRRSPSERELRARLRRSLTFWRLALKEDRRFERAAGRDPSIRGLRVEAYHKGTSTVIEIAILAVASSLRET